jgi:hypothetical protein
MEIVITEVLVRVIQACEPWIEAAFRGSEDKPKAIRKITVEYFGGDSTIYETKGE